MLLFTLKGTPFFFAGDEIGMTDVPIPPESVQDVFEKLMPGYGLNRDPERSPMRWDGSHNGGFTTGRPWLPMGDDVTERNVRSAQEDTRSLIWLYRRLIALRRNEPALTAGTYRPLRSRSDVLMFKRTHANTELLIALNFSASARRFLFEGRAHLLLSTHLDRDPAPLSSPSILRENEGAILRLLG
jgi:alpha-glucosidase